MQHGLHGVAGARQDGGHVGQVVFVRGVVGLDLVDVLPEEIGAEAVDAHVGLANGELFRSAGLLLHHVENVAARIADHAAVAGGVVHHGAHQDAGGGAFGLLRDQAAQRGGAQQRTIAVEHHQVAIQVRHGIAADHDGVAGALLFGLLDEADAGGGHGLAHLIGLVPDHGEDSLRRGEFERGIDDVLEQSLSAGLVQHFGLAALHAGAESGGEDDDGYGLVHQLLLCVLAAASFLGQFHHHGGGRVGIVADLVGMAGEVAGHDFEAHLHEGVDIVFHGQGGSLGVASS